MTAAETQQLSRQARRRLSSGLQAYVQNSGASLADLLM